MLSEAVIRVIFDGGGWQLVIQGTWRPLEVNCVVPVLSSGTPPGNPAVYIIPVCTFIQIRLN